MSRGEDGERRKRSWAERDLQDSYQRDQQKRDVLGLPDGKEGTESKIWDWG